MPSTRDPQSFYLREPRPLVWEAYQGDRQSCECRLLAEETDSTGRPKPNMSRPGDRHSLGTMYCRVPGSSPCILIGCVRTAERSTVDDHGLRWWFCDYCSPPVVGTEWYRKVMDPDSLQPPYEAWNEQCWDCICNCRECRDKLW